MASELCMNCFNIKGQYDVCPFCGYAEGTPPKQPHHLVPGTILRNQFIIGTVIGFGGFGITYKCFDTTLGVTVAVKEFYPAGLVNRSPGQSQVGLLSGEKAEQYREQLKRFLMEAQSVAKFGKAKDIVNVYDFFEQNGTAYIIMEYIDGILLKDYLEKQGAMHPEAARNLIFPIIEAVKKIHQEGIIHRDISPDNIFIMDEETIKVFDFGAAILNDSEEGMAAEAVIKVGYSAPEQYRDRARQDFYTDVYSVGAILYQMLTGVKPLESTEREYKDTLKSPHEMGAELSSNMDRAVMEALAVQPELRFQNIRQLEDALQNRRAAEYPKEKLRKRKLRRAWMISLAASLVLAVGVAIGLYSTILKPENRIFDSHVKEGTKITVWVENEDQKEQIERLKADGYIQAENKEGSKPPDVSERVKQMQKENAGVEVTVLVHPNMEKDLQKAKEEMPNMFLTDHVSNLSEYPLVSMKDNVYAALNIEDYLFMSEYERLFPGMKEMPTGIDTLLLYACEFDFPTGEGKRLKSSGHTKEEPTIELSELISGNKQDYEKKDENCLSPLLSTFPDHKALAYAMMLSNSGWENVFLKRENPDQEMVNLLLNIRRFNQFAEMDKYVYKNEKYWSNIVSGIAYRSKMERKENKKNNDKQTNHLVGYRPYVVTENGRMIVALSERYAITAASDENQKTACMRLLWVMMNAAGQKAKFIPSDKHANPKPVYPETSYPIRREQFEEFVDYDVKQKHLFIELVKKQYPCVLIGDISGQADKFLSGQEKIKIQNADKIRDYCVKYMNENN